MFVDFIFIFLLLLILEMNVRGGNSHLTCFFLFCFPPPHFFFCFFIRTIHVQAHIALSSVVVVSPFPTTTNPLSPTLAVVTKT